MVKCNLREKFFRKIFVRLKITPTFVVSKTK